jgi:diguanylate cyclase (GGDEF)-like protein
MLDRFIQDPEIMGEVERLLSGPTRDIRLRGKIADAFWQRSWGQTSKVIRAWMVWVMLVDLLMLAVNVFLLPLKSDSAMLVPGAFIVPAALLAAFAWRKPYPRRILEATLTACMLVILLSICGMGLALGGALLDRYLHIMLFVAITGVIIFNVRFVHTVAIASAGIGLYLAFQLGASASDIRTALSGFIFFASGVGATVMARKTMNVLAQKSFLLELRDRHRMAELAETNRSLERLSMIDGLTGAANRHFVRERMKALTGRDGKVAVLMCDIDHFKALNDHLGHLEGDRCLVEIARIIMACTRSQKDCVARYGGEEFLVILPDADEEAALTVAERIREDVAAAALPNPGSRVKPIVTLSVGVAAGSTGGDGPTLEELQLRADTALYVAKRAGRNRVQTWNEGSGALAKLGGTRGS